MEDARALLDSLMGPSRDNAEANAKGDGWKEKNVCKRYLVGFCPNAAQDNWFHNTRRKDISVCTKIHSDRLKDDFEKHPEREKYEAEYEKDFLDFLEGLVREADAWIARETSNCAPAGKVTKLPPSIKEKIAELKAQSEHLMKHAEDAVESNELASSRKSVEIADLLNKEILELKEKHTYESTGEKVCDICGVRCNPDEKADYQAHLNGRLHEGYTVIRQKVKELREKVRNRPVSRRTDDRDRDRKDDRDKDRKDKEKDGDRKKSDKDRDKDRDRDRDRDRRDRDRDRDRRDRSRDRRRDR